MDEKRFDRLEEHLVQLIAMVAENNKGQKRLEQRFDGLEQRFEGLEQRFEGLEQRFDGLEQRFDKEKEVNRARHADVIKEIRNINGSIDYLVTNYARHDIDIHKMKEVVYEKEQ